MAATTDPMILVERLTKTYRTARTGQRQRWTCEAVVCRKSH